MQRVLAMALKDLTLVSRDWLGLFFILALPVGMGIFFGAVMGSMADGGGGSSRLSVALVDEDQSSTSEKLVQSLQKNEKLNLSSMARQAAADEVRRGRIVGMIVLTKGFGETAGIMWKDPPVILLGMDPSRRAEAAMLQGYVMQALGELAGQRLTDPNQLRPLLRDAREQFENDPEIPAAMRPLVASMMGSLETFLDDLNAVQQQEQITGTETQASENNSGFNALQFARFEQVDVTKQVDPDSPEALYQKLQSQWDISFPQASLWGVLACAACFAGTIVREKSRGTLVRLQAAPVARAQIVAGKALACFLMVMLVLLMMTALGVALGMRPRNWPLLIASSIAVAYCFVGIMMLMSIMGRTEEAVAGASWGANMVMAMFGGGMIPLAFLPGIMQTLSHLSPVKWAILALEGSIWRGFSATEMLLPLSVLLGVGTLGLAVGTLILRRRMEQV